MPAQFSFGALQVMAFPDDRRFPLPHRDCAVVKNIACLIRNATSHSIWWS